MCGINGLLFQSRRPPQDVEPLIATMNGALAHRGPDDEGLWHSNDRRAYFGHRRLTILDLSSAGHQPMSLSDGTTIVFNGEIYNFREIRSQLPGHRFHSQSDTETLLALYREKGDACLSELNGMFAFAIWDAADSSLFLARDRIGKKPLYYATQGNVFAFSSEIKSLLTLPWVRRDLDEEALYHFLTFNFVPPPRTMFRDILKFHPGHKMCVGHHGVRSYESYWEPEYERTATSEEDLMAELRRRLDRSVVLRLVSDVPVGAFLSGGVDSGGIAALMSQRTSYPVKTYSIGFIGQPAYDESHIAARNAKLFNTEHHERQVSASDIRDCLPRIVDIFDEPMADPTCIPIYFLSQMAKEHGTKVVVTGDGPDELLLGYRNWMPYVRAYPWYRAYCLLPKILRRALARGATHVCRDSRVSEMLHRAANGQEFFWGHASSFKESTKRRFLSDDFANRIHNVSSSDLISSFRADYDRMAAQVGVSDSNWMAYLGLRFVIPNFYLYRTDRLGMANSIEIRAPYLDYHFVNFALSVPAKWKTLNGVPKYILKKSLAAELPATVLKRSKRGFCVPLREWAGDIMEDYLSANLRQFCEQTGLFDYRAMAQHMHTRRNGDTQRSFDMWNTYFLVHWFNRWLA